MPKHNEKTQKHKTPDTGTQIPITKSIINERIFRLDSLMFVYVFKKRPPSPRTTETHAKTKKLDIP